MSLNKKKRVPMGRLPALRQTIWSSPILAVKSERNGLDQNRFLVVVPAKKIRLSVDRHRIKRQILAAADSLPASGKDFLFIFRGGKKPTLAEWRSEFDKVRSKI